MSNPSKEHYQAYAQGLKALQKVIRICHKNGIYFYGTIVLGSVRSYAEPSLLIELNEVDLSNIFKVIRTYQNDTLKYIYVDIDGCEVRLTI